MLRQGIFGTLSMGLNIEWHEDEPATPHEKKAEVFQGWWDSTLRLCSFHARGS
jgi:hypothetical protein